MIVMIHNNYISSDPINFDSDSQKVERLLVFGRDLQSLFTDITKDTSSRPLQTLLQDSFSLLAYKDPYDSPVNYLLKPSQRESDTAALNSAILSTKFVTLFHVIHVCAAVLIVLCLYYLSLGALEKKFL